MGCAGWSKRASTIGAAFRRSPRPCQSGSALAASASAGARDQGGGQTIDRAIGDLSRLRPRGRDLGRSGPAHRAAASYRCGRLASHGRVVAWHDRRAAAGRGAHGNSGRCLRRSRPDHRACRRRPHARRKATSCACSRRAATSLPRYARRPMHCDGRPAATSFLTSSRATSITPISARSNASSAPSPKAR